MALTRPEQAKCLLNHILPPGQADRWKPVLDGRGIAVFDETYAAVPITAATVAAIGFERWALGRDVVVPKAVAADVANLLCGMAIRNTAHRTAADAALAGAISRHPAGRGRGLRDGGAE